jgi:hypothetical protein
MQTGLGPLNSLHPGAACFHPCDLLKSIGCCPTQADSAGLVNFGPNSVPFSSHLWMRFYCSRQVATGVKCTRYCKDLKARCLERAHAFSAQTLFGVEQQQLSQQTRVICSGELYAAPDALPHPHGSSRPQAGCSLQRHTTHPYVINTPPCNQHLWNHYPTLPP